MTRDAALIARLAAEVRAARRLLGWSQTRLADRAHTSQAAVSRVEHGNTLDVRFVTALGIARALGDALTALEPGTVTPLLHALCALARALPLPPPLAPASPLVRLLEHVHTLPPARRALFVALAGPLVDVLARPALVTPGPGLEPAGAVDLQVNAPPPETNTPGAAHNAPEGITGAPLATPRPSC